MLRLIDLWICGGPRLGDDSAGKGESDWCYRSERGLAVRLELASGEVRISEEEVSVGLGLGVRGVLGRREAAAKQLHVHGVHTCMECLCLYSHTCKALCDSSSNTSFICV